MKSTIAKTGGVALMLILALASVSIAETGTKDKEKIIDVASLTTAMQKATEPVVNRMKSSKLSQRFNDVKQLLKQDKVDKESLQAALGALQSEINTFTADWESVTKPLWEGQEALSKTIDKVRGLLAGAKGGKSNKKTAAIIVNYDKRLRSLARAVQAEKDPRRKERLKAIFGNVLGLRRLTEKLGGINLAPATEALYVRIVQALSGLQDQLTLATFEVEKVRIVLTSESEFVSSYAEVLQGMMEAEKLAKVLGSMKTDGTDIAGLSINVGQLQSSAEEFAEMMNGFAGKLADSIETETAGIADEMQARSPLNDKEIDEAIIQYSRTEKVVGTKIVVEK